jgi:hypothetical protein
MMSELSADDSAVACFSRPPPLPEFSQLHLTLPDLASTLSTANPWALPTANLITRGTRTLQ